MDALKAAKLAQAIYEEDQSKLKSSLADLGTTPKILVCTDSIQMAWAMDMLFSKFKNLEGDAHAPEFGGYKDWILPGAAVGTVAAAGAGAWWAKGRQREGPLKRAEHRLGLI